MEAFNCAKPPKAPGSLPPLPRGRSRSLKSTMTCGTASTTPVQNERKALSAPQNMHDPYSYDSVSMTRDLFRGFIIQRKESLTKKEHEYLENLVEDGEEDDLNQAMLVLSDRQLFFSPRNWVEKSAARLLGCAPMSTLSRSDSDPALDSVLDMKHISSDTGESNKENPQEECNVEIIDTGYGAIILQDLETPTNSKNTKGKDENFESFQYDEICESVDLSFVTPEEKVERVISEPQTAPARIGTPHRQQRVAERKQSAVHSYMWKAHKQGLSLTPASSFQSAKEYNKTFATKKNLLNGQRSGTSSPYIGRHSRKGSRVKGRGSAAMRTSGSTQSSKQMTDQGPVYSIPWINHAQAQQLDMHEVDSDVPSINAVRGRMDSSSTWGSDEILDRGMIADSSFSTRDLWKSGRFHSTISSISASDLANSMHSLSTDALARDSPARRVSQSSLTSFPSLHQGYSFSDSMRQSSNSLHQLPSRTNSDGFDESLQESFLSLHQGQSFSESMNSIPSIHFSQPVQGYHRDSNQSSVIPSMHPSQPERQQSNISTLSRPSRGFHRESSYCSAASSVTLNDYELERDLSNTSNESSTGSSFRCNPPMRPTRSPSPYASRPKMVRRAVSDGILPPRRSSTTSDVRQKVPAVPKVLPRRKSIAGKYAQFYQLTNTLWRTTANPLLSERIDILETIVSQDRAQDDDSINVPSIQSDTSDMGQPVLIRKASSGNDWGFGVEIAGLDNSINVETMLQLERLEKSRDLILNNSTRSGRSEADERLLDKIGGGDFDSGLLERTEIRQCNSEDHFLHRENGAGLLLSLLDGSEDDDVSAETDQYYDSWHVLTEDGEEHDFCFEFQILGTSADDSASMPHVLSPPLMESLLHFLPYSVSEQNYFMKYSLIRDGASFISLLQHIRGSTHTLFALETTDGEVFGSFTSSPW